MLEIPTDYQRLETSERKAASGARNIGPADPKEVLSVSVRVRRRPDAPALPEASELAATGTFLSREEFAARYGAAQEDLDRVAEFARSHGLALVESSIPRRTVVVSGTVEQMSRAFAVELSRFESSNQNYRGREEYVHLPRDLANIVEGIFGLDNRRMARRATNGGTITALNPVQVAKLYRFPTSANGSGQTIGLLEFGGGYIASDISDYFTTNKGIGPGFTTPALTAIGVDGVAN